MLQNLEEENSQYGLQVKKLLSDNRRLKERVDELVCLWSVDGCGG